MKRIAILSLLLVGCDVSFQTNSAPVDQVLRTHIFQQCVSNMPETAGADGIKACDRAAWEQSIRPPVVDCEPEQTRAL